MCVADDKDLGVGLSFTRTEINSREATKARLASLADALGGDPEDLTKPLSLLDAFNPEHALTFLFDMDYLEPGCLSMDVHNAKYSRIRWFGTAKDAKTGSTLANGNHRIALIQSIFQSKVERLNTIVEHSIPNTQELDDLEQLEKERADIELFLREKASWLVAVYDLYAIDGSSARHDIQFELGRNSHKYQAQDTQEEGFTLLIRTLSHLPPDKRSAAISEENSRNSNISNKDSYLYRFSATLHSHTLILAFVNLYRHSQVWNGDSLSYKQVYNWRTSVAPVSSFILARLCY